jgi:5'/3'-nucleotidase SurE
MNVKRILLTGDDGYDSIGTRLLIHFLKNSYELVIAGTRDQQSGVGGHISMRDGCEWGETKVDGVPAYWVDGYPADAIESFVGLYKSRFDLVISGINWGANIGPGVTSGTVSAAVRALSIGLSERAVILSWHLPPSYWFKQRKCHDDLDKYLQYPGKVAFDVVMLAITHNLWGADILNINFPQEESRRLRFTKSLEDLTKFYNFPVDRDYKTHTFTYPNKELRKYTARKPYIDTGALFNGYISVTPWNKNMMNDKIFHKNRNQEIHL